VIIPIVAAIAKGLDRGASRRLTTAGHRAWAERRTSNQAGRHRGRSRCPTSRGGRPSPNGIHSGFL